MNRSALRLAVLLSGGGTTLQNLIDHIEAGTLSASIVVVISSQPDAYGLVRAKRHGVEAICIPRKAYRNAEAYDAELNRTLDRFTPDLIALAGFLHVFGFAPHYRGRILNIHPSLIPAFCGKGLYGLRVHQAALAYGVKVSGCTVHFADEECDHGPIIVQRVVPVLDHDTPERLAERVAIEERKAYPEVIQLFAEGRLQVQGRWVKILEAAPSPVPPPGGQPGKER
ncbi:MAG TPA: phosphoribosylglycinamide formyltransferase [Candidatus Tectomicrobia bacterium]|nr:phosphoribosylglycinamide formyltransferase [Candidatus Tectomicrobia bacterium]